MKKQINRSGLSLVEIAIAMLIISAAFGSIVATLPSSLRGDEITQINSKLDKIEKAIYAFYHQNGYIPCPAEVTIARTDSTYGVSTDCSAAPPSGVTDMTPTSMSIRLGMVPFKSLNLPEDYAYDSWDMRINYGIVKGLGVNSTTFNTTSLTVADPFTINDASGTKINQFGANTFVAYALWSGGKNRKGTHAVSGVANISCGSSGLDYENCNKDQVFTDSPHNYDAATYYDDFFRWRTNTGVISYAGGSLTNCSSLPSGFTPNSVYGLALWLDASDLTKITKDGSNNVSEWRDKSYYGFIFQPAGSNKPVYSATGFNGKQAMTFNNKNGFQLVGQVNPYTMNRTNLTAFFVGRQNATSGANYIIDYYSTSSRFGMNLNMTGTNFWYRQDSSLYTGTTYSSNLYATWLFNDGGSPEASLYVNGTLVTSNSSFVALSSSSTCMKIAESCVSGGPTNFYGEIAEIVLYDRPLSTKERQNVESYLKSKWGL